MGENLNLNKIKKNKYIPVITVFADIYCTSYFFSAAVIRLEAKIMQNTVQRGNSLRILVHIHLRQLEIWMYVAVNYLQTS